MSKKFEYLKKAILYSEQKPDMLAELLAGLVTDVVTSVTVSGTSEITIPSGDTATTKTYTATVLSQYGDAMADQSITWSIPETTGVSINSSTGVLSVGKTASAGKVTVTATCGSKTGSFEVTLTAS